MRRIKEEIERNRNVNPRKHIARIKNCMKKNNTSINKNEFKAYFNKILSINVTKKNTSSESHSTNIYLLLCRLSPHAYVIE